MQNDFDLPSANLEATSTEYSAVQCSVAQITLSANRPERHAMDGVCFPAQEPSQSQPETAESGALVILELIRGSALT